MVTLPPIEQGSATESLVLSRTPQKKVFRIFKISVFGQKHVKSPGIQQKTSLI
jgi:hypothetical protein